MLGFTSAGVGLQVDLFVFHGAPQPLDEDVVSVPPFPVHADSDPVPLQDPGEGLARKLAPLVGVEDLRRSFAQRLLQCPYFAAFPEGLSGLLGLERAEKGGDRYRNGLKVEYLWMYGIYIWQDLQTCLSQGDSDLSSGPVFGMQSQVT